MRFFILILFLFAGCAQENKRVPIFLSNYQDAQGNIVVDGNHYCLAEPWKDDKLTLWESVPKQTNQFFIANILSVKNGGKPMMNRRNREK